MGLMADRKKCLNSQVRVVSCSAVFPSVFKSGPGKTCWAYTPASLGICISVGHPSDPLSESVGRIPHPQDVSSQPMADTPEVNIVASIHKRNS